MKFVITRTTDTRKQPHPDAYQDDTLAEQWVDGWVAMAAWDDEEPYYALWFIDLDMAGLIALAANERVILGSGAPWWVDHAPDDVMTIEVYDGWRE